MSFPTLIVDVAFGAAPGTTYLHFDDTTRGKFDTGKLAPDFVGYDITADVRSFTIRRGRQRLLEETAPGVCDIVLDNNQGDYDPNNLSGRFVSGGVSLVKPMARVRVRASFGGTTYSLFYGFVDAWDNAFPYYGADRVTNLRCTDAFKVLARHENGSPSAAVGAGERTGTRIARLLTDASWPAEDRDLDTGNSPQMATTLSENTLTEIQAAAFAEGGYVYISKDGKFTFRDRHSRVEDTRSINVQATFDDDGTDLPYADIQIADDDDLIKNLVNAQRDADGATPQTASDSTSIGDYMTRTYNAMSLSLDDDVEVANWASWILALFKDWESRVDSITIKPQRSDALWPVVLGALMGDLMVVNRRPRVGTAIAKSVFLEGIGHDVTGLGGSRGQWVTQFRFSSATALIGQLNGPFASSAQWLLLDNATVGKFDTGKFGAW